jgi:hypothetical protein
MANSDTKRRSMMTASSIGVATPVSIVFGTSRIDTNSMAYRK